MDFLGRIGHRLGIFCHSKYGIGRRRFPWLTISHRRLAVILRTGNCLTGTLIRPANQDKSLENLLLEYGTTNSLVIWKANEK